ncbi:MAG: hypothetical protein ABDH21_06500 [bacterium]
MLFQSIALFPLLLYSFNGYIDEKYVAHHLIEYTRSIDKESLLLTVSGYLIFNFSFINFMRFLNYRPIIFSLKKIGYLDVKGFDLFILLISLVVIYSYLTHIIISFRIFEFFHAGTTYEIRFEVTRGPDAIIFKIIEIFVPVVLAVTYMNIKSMRMKKNYSERLINLFLFVSSSVVLFIAAILFGIRGLGFFSLLFIVFILYGSNLSLARLLKSFINLKIGLHFAYALFLFGIGLVYFYFYSITRGIEGDLAKLILTRADFILASYVAITQDIIDINLQKIIYPFTVYIPRDFLENKQYPAVVDITWMIFGPNDRFGAEFGIVAESFYVLPFAWLIFSAFLLALVMKYVSFVSSKTLINIYDLFIVKTTYYYVGIQAFGAISQATGDLIFMLPILAFLSSLRNRRI